METHRLPKENVRAGTLPLGVCVWEQLANVWQAQSTEDGVRDGVEQHVTCVGGPSAGALPFLNAGVSSDMAGWVVKACWGCDMVYHVLCAVVQAASTNAWHTMCCVL